MGRTKKLIYIFIGTVCLVLGAIGLFLPLLPTTPFWLLTCWCYLRSSERLYNRVMANRYFGSYMEDYMVHKAIPLRAKVMALSIMWLSMLFTSFLLIDPLWIKLCLLLISIAVTWHILSFPTKKSGDSVF
ncbi:MAG: YbaN family protein [Massilibacteroides sp.]|nr:YbaN family protein [Massilibacteroides sp.]MDD3061625.1 YbaN family protein [Massilibacteroides sp.]MDD4114912.1 YbaN family protein [Massilibacteroides sp.]MDD4659991.1 YbaN family protein [Massilibacteroides sp.]